MTKRIISPVVRLVVFALFSATMLSNSAFADTETDRLREALRSATAQTRQLEDQRTALQAKVADTDREKAVAKAQVDAAKAEVRDIQKQHREAVEEFNKRLAERDETLEKWKSAYEEAATVARSKDAERAKFEGQANAYKASAKGCVVKNDKMFKAGNELLHQYQAVTIGDTIVAQEPVLGLRRVEIQNDLQTTRTSSSTREQHHEQPDYHQGQNIGVHRDRCRNADLCAGHWFCPDTANCTTFCAGASEKPRPAPQVPAQAAVQPATQGTAIGKASGSSEIVARVGDANLSADDIRGYVAALAPREQGALAQDPALLSQAVRMMLANRVVLQEVIAKKWDQQPDVAAQLDRIRENALIELYLQTASTPPSSYPSDDELQKVYDANRAALLMPRQFQLAQIFVPSPKDADKATEDRAKKAVEDIQRKLKAPAADFAAIAIEAGDKNGGDLGWVAETQIRPEIRTPVMGLGKNALSEPIRLDDGWHIIKLVDTKALLHPHAAGSARATGPADACRARQGTAPSLPRRADQAQSAGAQRDRAVESSQRAATGHKVTPPCRCRHRSQRHIPRRTRAANG